MVAVWSLTYHPECVISPNPVRVTLLNGVPSFFGDDRSNLNLSRGSLSVCAGLAERILSRALTTLATMARRGHSSGLFSSIVACLAFSCLWDAQAFVLPFTGVSRSCSASSLSLGGNCRASTTAVKSRELKLGVTSGARAIGNASEVSADDGEAMRIAQIQGFTDKVCALCCLGSGRWRPGSLFLRCFVFYRRSVSSSGLQLNREVNVQNSAGRLRLEIGLGIGRCNNSRFWIVLHAPRDSAGQQ